MKSRIATGLSALLIAFFSLSLASCNKSSKTSFLPLPSGGGGGTGGGALVSATAVMVNAATEAENTSSVYKAFNNAGYGIAIWESYSGYTARYLYSIYNPAQNQWSAAAEFARNIGAPSLASNGTSIMVVFTYSNKVLARSWSGGTLSDPVNITPLGTSCNMAAVASNGTGYCAAWTQYDGVNGRYDVRAAIHNGTSWGSMTTIETTQTPTPNEIRITTGGSAYCVSWTEDYSISASIFNGSWSAVQNIVPALPANHYLNEYYLSGNSAGVFAVVFQDYDGSTYINAIKTQVFDGSTASGVQDISQNSVQNAENIGIATNGTTFCAAWNQYETTGSNRNVYARIYDGGWGAAVEIDNLANYASYARIASDGAGYCVAWNQSNGSGYKMFVNRYAGSSWQGPEVLNPASTVNTDYPGISYNGADYLAFWMEEDSATPASRYQLYTSSFSGSAWSTPVQIDVRASMQYSISMSRFSGGYACMFYSVDADTAYHLYANVYEGGAWSGSLDYAVSGFRGSCTATATVPKLYRAGASTVAVWRQFDSSNSGRNLLYASVKTGSAWSAPLLLCDDPGTYYYAASSGSAVCVVWTEYDNTEGRNVVYSKIFSGGAWGADTMVDNPLHYAYEPWVAGNASTNDFCVTWQQYDGTANSRAYANIHNTTTGWAGPQQIDDPVGGDSVTQYIVAGTGRYCVAVYQDGRTHGAIFNGTTWIERAAHLHDSVAINPTNRIMAASGDQFAVTYMTSSNVYTNVHDGTSWSGMEIRDKVDANPADWASLAGDGSGGFCLVWPEHNGMIWELVSRLYDGSSWGSAESVETGGLFDPSYSASAPIIASNGTGYAVAFVKQDPYSTYSLYAAVHDGVSWLDSDLLENGLADINNYTYQIASSGTGYGVIWQQRDTAFNVMLYGTAYNGGAWTGEPLSNGEGDVSNADVIGMTGGSYAAAWYQVDAEDELVKNHWTNIFD